MESGHSRMVRQSSRRTWSRCLAHVLRRSIFAMSTRASTSWSGVWPPASAASTRIRTRGPFDQLSTASQDRSRVLDGGSTRADYVAVVLDVTGKAEGLEG